MRVPGVVAQRFARPQQPRLIFHPLSSLPTTLNKQTKNRQGQTRELLQPRPHLSDYYGRMKTRPSFAKVFGPAQSGATAARAILPAVGKAVWARVTGRY